MRVRHVERDDDGARLVHVVTDDEAASACPVGGVFSTSIRQRRTTRPRDLPYGEQLLVVRWHKVQFACRSGGVRGRRSPSRSRRSLPVRA